MHLDDRQNRGRKRAVLFLLLLPLTAAAQPLPLTLRRAVDIALESNTRLQLSGEAVRQAESRSAQARASLLPSLDSSLAYQNQTRNLAAFGIRVDLPIPGFRFPERVGPFTTFDARLTASQSVFDFASIRRYQASRTGIGTAKAENDSARDQVAAQVAGLYMTALAAQEHVEAAEANVQLAEALQKLAQNRKDAGTGTGIDVTRAQVQLANERQRLLVAQNQRRQAELQLLRAMGVNLDRQVELGGKLAYQPPDNLTVEQALKSALEARAEWKAQQQREESARLSYGAVKSERLPSLAGFADYGTIGAGIDNAVPTRTYGVALRLPLFDGGRRDARRGEAAAQLRQERVRTADLKQQIELEIRLALDNLKSASEQVEVAQGGLKQSEQEMEQARRRFDAGVATSLEPTDAQTRLERARDNLISALLNYNLARVQFAQAAGTIRQSLD